MSLNRKQQRASQTGSGKMHILVAPIFLFIGSTSAIKQGDFGIFNGCITKNKSLRLDCFYAPCANSPIFYCEFMNSKGELLAKSSSQTECKYTLIDHPQRYHNETTIYNCTLIRKDRKEKKHIVIDYSIKTGKERIKRCSSTAGLRLHPAPIVLRSVVILSTWTVLLTDGLKTT